MAEMFEQLFMLIKNNEALGLGGRPYLVESINKYRGDVLFVGYLFSVMIFEAYELRCIAISIPFNYVVRRPQCNT
jgi:hypothetical protein